MFSLLTKHALNEYFTVILYNNKPVMLGGPFTVKKLDYVLCILFFQSLDRTKDQDEPFVFSSHTRKVALDKYKNKSKKKQSNCLFFILSLMSF